MKFLNQNAVFLHFFLLTAFQFLLPLQTWSQQSRPDFCSEGHALTNVRQIPLKGAEVNYFMRSAPQTKELGFSTNLTKENQINKILNTVTNKTTDVIGFIDPVLSPDGKIIATPSENFFDPTTGKFVAAINRPFYYLEEGLVKYCAPAPEVGCKSTKIPEEELRKGTAPFKMMTMTFLDRSGKELLVDTGVNSAYQTLGQFNSGTKSVNYRLLFETAEGLKIRDYQKSNADGSFTATSETKKICGGKILVLPSLSKSGLELSAFDPMANETHIYEIDESGLDCKLKEKFPGMIGKADFSPNSRKIAFHVDHASAIRLSIFKTPNEYQNLTSYIYDRDKKSFRPLLDIDGEQSYFPVFLGDDELALVTAKKNSVGGNESFAISIGFLKPNSIHNQCESCANPNHIDGQRSAFIGAIVDEKCRSNVDYNYKSAFFAFSHLSAESCRAVLRSCNSDCINSLKQKITKHASQDLKALKNKTKSASILWNRAGIENLEVFDDHCEKIKPLASFPGTDTTDSATRR